MRRGDAFPFSLAPLFFYYCQLYFVFISEESKEMVLFNLGLGIKLESGNN